MKHFNVLAVTLFATFSVVFSAQAESNNQKVNKYASCSGYAEYSKIFSHNQGQFSQSKQFEKAEKYTLRYANELADGDKSLEASVALLKEQAKKEAYQASMSTPEAVQQIVKLIQYCMGPEVYFPLVIRYEGLK